jgi:hypothetical protein
MTIREFEVLTGFHPSTAHYEVIEQDYNSSQLDKYEYCEAYKADKGGIAERLARLADKCAWERDNKHADELKASFTEIKLLHDRLAEAKAQLDRELDWQPAKNLGTNMSEREYQLLADDTAPMSELDAIRRIAKECGFDMACIHLVQTVETFDKNKYGKCRVSGSYSRLPVWASTDWNYIRFQVCGNQWEIVNGELQAYYS